jgi:hypothetical protein
MKITEIKQKEYSIYEVSFEPNWLERLFGAKPKVREYKHTGREYTFGGGRVYVDKTGKELGNGSPIGEAIDRSRRAF